MLKQKMQRDFTCAGKNPNGCGQTGGGIPARLPSAAGLIQTHELPQAVCSTARNIGLTSRAQAVGRWGSSRSICQSGSTNAVFEPKRFHHSADQTAGDCLRKDVGRVLAGMNFAQLDLAPGHVSLHP